MKTKLLTAVCVVALLCAPAVFGSTIVVTNTNDSGSGSLRAAIAAAAPGDTINFNLTYPATITLSSTLEIGKNLTISGPGASNLAVSGNHSVPVLVIWPQITASISWLTIENGTAAYGWSGGGIRNEGTLTLTNCTVSGHSNDGGFGGGILNLGTLTLANSTVSDNHGGVGSGIFNSQGTMTLTNSTVSGNSPGSGIRNDGTATLTNSTISGNSAVDGGGIYNVGTLALTNSTLSGNSAVLRGGAIYIAAGTVALTNVTVSGNSASYSGGILLDSGSVYGVGTLTLKNTILANNSSPSGGNCASWGTNTSLGYNLSDFDSGHPNDCSSFLTATGDRNNTPAGLDPKGLQNKGGPTQTIALLSTSPAVDDIPLSSCTDVNGNAVTTDQRGTARPQGSACDIGAFELVSLIPFRAFSVGAALDLHDNAFAVLGKFTLAAGSNGIAPIKEAVQLQIGPFSTTIPAGSFKSFGNGFTLFGVVNGVSLAMAIEPFGKGSYIFAVLGKGGSLAGTANPVRVGLTIGDDAGSAGIKAIFF
jgi:hypothetical protein